MNDTYSLESPSQKKWNSLGKFLSPSRELSASINAVSKHNRSSMLRLEKAGFVVQSPVKSNVTPLKNFNHEKIPCVLQSTPGKAALSNKEMFHTPDTQNKLIEKENCEVFTVEDCTKPPARTVEKTPLQAFVSSIGDSSPLTRSARRRLEDKGSLVTYQESDIIVFAPKP